MSQLHDPNGEGIASILPRNAASVDLSSTDATFTNEVTLYVGATGDIKVDLGGSGSGITFKSVPVGPFPYAVTKVYKVGTSATELIATW